MVRKFQFSSKVYCILAQHFLKACYPGLKVSNFLPKSIAFQPKKILKAITSGTPEANKDVPKSKTNHASQAQDTIGLKNLTWQKCFGIQLCPSNPIEIQHCMPYLPFLSWSKCSYTKYVLLRNIKKPTPTRRKFHQQCTASKPNSNTTLQSMQ